MKFKTPELESQYLTQIANRLKYTLLQIDTFIQKARGEELIITSLIRKDNPNSVHYYGRGADARSFWVENKETLMWRINSRLPYGKGNYKTILLENKNTKNEHFHIQVKA